MTIQHPSNFILPGKLVKLVLKEMTFCIKLIFNSEYLPSPPVYQIYI